MGVRYAYRFEEGDSRFEAVINIQSFEPVLRHTRSQGFGAGCRATLDVVGFSKFLQHRGFTVLSDSMKPKPQNRNLVVAHL